MQVPAGLFPLDASPPFGDNLACGLFGVRNVAKSLYAVVGGLNLRVLVLNHLPDDLRERLFESRAILPKSGILAGYPLINVKVTLIDGSYHDVDSNELAFKMAAIFGFKEGCRKASPVILEPMMAVEVETPEDYAGNVMGDLSSRRGMVQGMDDMVGGGKAIKAEVPLSEMFGYATSVRGMSQGRASYSMEPLDYRPVPDSITRAVLEGTAKGA